MYDLRQTRNRRKERRPLNISQNKFDRGYISTIDNSRRILSSLSDMTNMEVTQDNIVRPRPPLIEYGVQPAAGEIVTGRMNVKYDGERWVYILLSEPNLDESYFYKQKDGGVWENAVSTPLVSSYLQSSTWTSGVQSKGKLYPFNGIDNLCYINLENDAFVDYTAIATPSAPTVTKTGMTGTTFTHYYRISANNNVGESIASTAGTVTSGKLRDSWINGTDYTTVSWAAVPGATSYTVYYGNSPGTLNELYTVPNATSFTDYGNIAVNPFKLASEGNSTEGPVFIWMYVDTKNSQLFGITAENKLYYSAPGTSDFSAFNGGGWVGIDEDGDSTLNFATGFRNGKGDPVITASLRGAAGAGTICHVSFDTLTIGDQSIIYPNVIISNGQSGTYSARATVKARDSIWYPTGLGFKTTGTSQNINNILTTNSMSQAIEPDLEKINLAALQDSVGVEYKDKIYWALPISADGNNEIWVLDLSRRNIWTLRWTVDGISEPNNPYIRDMWLYEDSSGKTHFCILYGDGHILEFTRTGAVPHTDNNSPFRSRVAFESLKWDENGLVLGSIRNMYFKFLFPKGVINVNVNGLSRKGLKSSAGSDTFNVTTANVGYDQMTWDNHVYDEAPGNIGVYAKSVAVLRVKPKGLLNQLDWEVVADSPGTDYYLSAVNTRGYALDDLIIKAK